MSLVISANDGFIRIQIPGYITSYSVLKSKFPLQVPDEFWDMISEIDLDDEIERLEASDIEKIISFRKECLKRVKNITSIKLKNLCFIDICEFVDFDKITKFKLNCRDTNNLLLKCSNLRELTLSFGFSYPFDYIIKVIEYLSQSLVKLKLEDLRFEKNEVEGLSNSILSLKKLIKFTLYPSCIGYNLVCLQNVRIVVLKDYEPSKRESVVNLISLNSYKLRQIHCLSQPGHGNDIYWLERYSLAPILENKYLEFFGYGIRFGVCSAHTMGNLNNRQAAQKEYLTILCIGKYKRKDIGPLYNFCEQIGKLLYIMR